MPHVSSCFYVLISNLDGILMTNRAYEISKWRSPLLRVDDGEVLPKYSDVDEKTGVEGEIQRS